MNRATTETRPDLTDRELEDVEHASETYPSVQLPTGQGLHVYQRGGEWCVWLNTEASDFDGLCVAVAVTRDAALGQAVAVFQAAIEELQKPRLDGVA